MHMKVCGVESEPMVVIEAVHFLGKGPAQQNLCNFAVLDDECLPYDVIIGTPILSVLGASICFARWPHHEATLVRVSEDMEGAFCVPITSTDAAMSHPASSGSYSWHLSTRSKHASTDVVPPVPARSQGVPSSVSF